eukprot:GHVH01003282.1.p1 GENE.GHVH01003282.1~~GHVH01003282.1.p1  ORF type:complete len:2540 (+),score=334.95 GHVH01003282.1:1070-8689(+)
MVTYFRGLSVVPYHRYHSSALERDVNRIWRVETISVSDDGNGILKQWHDSFGVRIELRLERPVTKRRLPKKEKDMDWEDKKLNLMVKRFMIYVKTFQISNSMSWCFSRLQKILPHALKLILFFIRMYDRYFEVMISLHITNYAALGTERRDVSPTDDSLRLHQPVFHVSFPACETLNSPVTCYSWADVFQMVLISNGNLCFVILIAFLVGGDFVDIARRASSWFDWSRSTICLTLSLVFIFFIFDFISRGVRFILLPLVKTNRRIALNGRPTGASRFPLISIRAQPARVRIDDTSMFVLNRSTAVILSVERCGSSQDGLRRDGVFYSLNLEVPSYMPQFFVIFSQLLSLHPRLEGVAEYSSPFTHVITLSNVPRQEDDGVRIENDTCSQYAGHHFKAHLRLTFSHKGCFDMVSLLESPRARVCIFRIKNRHFIADTDHNNAPLARIQETLNFLYIFGDIFGNSMGQFPVCYEPELTGRQFRTRSIADEELYRFLISQSDSSDFFELEHNGSAPLIDVHVSLTPIRFRVDIGVGHFQLNMEDGGAMKSISPSDYAKKLEKLTHKLLLLKKCTKRRCESTDDSLIYIDFILMITMDSFLLSLAPACKLTDVSFGDKSRGSFPMVFAVMMNRIDLSCDQKLSFDLGGFSGMAGAARLHNTELSVGLIDTRSNVFSPLVCGPSSKPSAFSEAASKFDSAEYLRHVPPREEVAISLKHRFELPVSVEGCFETVIDRHGNYSVISQCGIDNLLVILSCYFISHVKRIFARYPKGVPPEPGAPQKRPVLPGARFLKNSDRNFFISCENVLTGYMAPFFRFALTVRPLFNGTCVTLNEPRVGESLDDSFRITIIVHTPDCDAPTMVIPLHLFRAHLELGMESNSDIFRRTWCSFKKDITDKSWRPKAHMVCLEDHPTIHSDVCIACPEFYVLRPNSICKSKARYQSAFLQGGDNGGLVINAQISIGRSTHKAHLRNGLHLSIEPNYSRVWLMKEIGDCIKRHVAACRLPYSPARGCRWSKFHWECLGFLTELPDLAGFLRRGPLRVPKEIPWPFDPYQGGVDNFSVFNDELSLNSLGSSSDFSAREDVGELTERDGDNSDWWTSVDVPVAGGSLRLESSPIYASQSTFLFSGIKFLPSSHIPLRSSTLLRQLSRVVGCPSPDAKNNRMEFFNESAAEADDGIFMLFPQKVWLTFNFIDTDDSQMFTGNDSRLQVSYKKGSRSYTTCGRPIGFSSIETKRKMHYSVRYGYKLDLRYHFDSSTITTLDPKSIAQINNDVPLCSSTFPRHIPGEPLCGVHLPPISIMILSLIQDNVENFTDSSIGTFFNGFPCLLTISKMSNRQYANLNDIKSKNGKISHSLANSHGLKPGDFIVTVKQTMKIQSFLPSACCISLPLCHRDSTDDAPWLQYNMPSGGNVSPRTCCVSVWEWRMHLSYEGISYRVEFPDSTGENVTIPAHRTNEEKGVFSCEGIIKIIPIETKDDQHSRWLPRYLKFSLSVSSVSFKDHCASDQHFSGHDDVLMRISPIMAIQCDIPLTYCSTSSFPTDVPGRVKPLTGTTSNLLDFGKQDNPVISWPMSQTDVAVTEYHDFATLQLGANRTNTITSLVQYSCSGIGAGAPALLTTWESTVRQVKDIKGAWNVPINAKGVEFNKDEKLLVKCTPPHLYALYIEDPATGSSKPYPLPDLYGVLLRSFTRHCVRPPRLQVPVISIRSVLTFFNATDATLPFTLALVNPDDTSNICLVEGTMGAGCHMSPVHDPMSRCFWVLNQERLSSAIDDILDSSPALDSSRPPLQEFRSSGSGSALTQGTKKGSRRIGEYKCFMICLEHLSDVYDINAPSSPATGASRDGADNETPSPEAVDPPKCLSWAFLIDGRYPWWTEGKHRSSLLHAMQKSWGDSFWVLSPQEDGGLISGRIGPLDALGHSPIYGTSSVDNRATLTDQAQCSQITFCGQTKSSSSTSYHPATNAFFTDPVHPPVKIVNRYSESEGQENSIVCHLREVNQLSDSVVGPGLKIRPETELGLPCLTLSGGVYIYHLRDPLPLGFVHESVFQSQIRETMRLEWSDARCDRPIWYRIMRGGGSITVVAGDDLAVKPPRSLNVKHTTRAIEMTDLDLLHDLFRMMGGGVKIDLLGSLELMMADPGIENKKANFGSILVHVLDVVDVSLQLNVLPAESDKMPSVCGEDTTEMVPQNAYITSGPASFSSDLTPLVSKIFTNHSNDPTPQICVSIRYIVWNLMAAPVEDLGAVCCTEIIPASPPLNDSIWWQKLLKLWPSESRKWINLLTAKRCTDDSSQNLLDFCGDIGVSLFDIIWLLLNEDGQDESMRLQVRNSINLNLLFKELSDLEIIALQPDELLKWGVMAASLTKQTTSNKSTISPEFVDYPWDDSANPVEASANSEGKGEGKKIKELGHIRVKIRSVEIVKRDTKETTQLSVSSLPKVPKSDGVIPVNLLVDLAKDFVLPGWYERVQIRKLLLNTLQITIKRTRKIRTDHLKDIASIQVPLFQKEIMMENVLISPTRFVKDFMLPQLNLTVKDILDIICNRTSNSE